MIKPTDDHFDLTIRHDLRAASGFTEPLKHGQPTPGCGCVECTGIAPDDPRRHTRQLGNFSDWEMRADKARSISLLAVVRELGIETKKKGAGLYAKCPLHDDNNPSLHLSPEKGRAGLWYCPVCAVGGDPIALWQRVKRRTFPETVRDLVGPEL